MRDDGSICDIRIPNGRTHLPVDPRGQIDTRQPLLPQSSGSHLYLCRSNESHSLLPWAPPSHTYLQLLIEVIWVSLSSFYTWLHRCFAKSLLLLHPLSMTLQLLANLVLRLCSRNRLFFMGPTYRLFPLRLLLTRREG